MLCGCVEERSKLVGELPLSFSRCRAAACVRICSRVYVRVCVSNSKSKSISHQHSRKAEIPGNAPSHAPQSCVQQLSVLSCWPRATPSCRGRRARPGAAGAAAQRRRNKPSGKGAGMDLVNKQADTNVALDAADLESEQAAASKKEDFSDMGGGPGFKKDEEAQGSRLQEWQGTRNSRMTSNQRTQACWFIRNFSLSSRPRASKCLLVVKLAATV